MFVELTLVSGDGRPYVCSGRTQLTAWLTSEVSGRRQGSKVVLRQTGAQRVDGQCQPPPRQPLHLEAELAGDQLLVAGLHPVNKLVRRRLAPPEPASTGAELFLPPATRLAFISTPPAGRLHENPVLVQGHWVWEQQGQLPNGDNKREREEWHLVQEGPEFVGFYDRTVELRSTDGRLYRCNSAIDFRTVTRYEVRGVVSGEHFVIAEHGFEVLEGGPCDDGRRQLDTYQGEVQDTQMVLRLGAGQQILRKARPTVPTQTF